MKRLLYIIMCIAFACACTKTVVITDPYSSGVCVGEILLGSQKGKLSVSVETKDNWRLESDSEWLIADTDGRTGNGAFTVYYTSNESNVQALKSTRTAKLVIHVEESMKADTIYFVQRGLYPVKAVRNITNDPALALEYNLQPENTLTLVCCDIEDAAEVEALTVQHNPDVIVNKGVISFKEGIGHVNNEGIGLVNTGDFKIAGCNYAGMTEDEEYDAFRSLINSTYNAGPDAGDNWIFAGQMYHLSSMMIGYKGTPDWYPTSTVDSKFRADIFAWQNNLYDCVWMYNQDYVATYTDTDSERAYSADYVYVSPSVFSKIEFVEVMEVDGLEHKPIKVTLKY